MRQLRFSFSMIQPTIFGKLVDYDAERKGPYELKRWSSEKHILGLMRIIPEAYFKNGYLPEMLKKDP